MIDAEEITYGLPFAYSTASRTTFVVSPWHYNFMWWFFVIDFLIYWLIISGVTSFYFLVNTRGFFKSPRNMMAFDIVSGGLLFALLSGLYPVKWLYQYNGEKIAYGFPLGWFEADWVNYRSWVYQFVLQSFAVDFVIYGLVVGVVVYLYLRSTKSVRLGIS